MNMDTDSNNDTKKQFVEHLYEAAGRGDIARIESLTRVQDIINERNSHGWTALMFAARNGQNEAVQCLLRNGSDASVMTTSGQTARDIAKFWNHRNVVRIFEDNPTLGFQNDQNVVNFFGHNPLDRSAHRRSNKEWIATSMKDARSVFVLFSDAYPLVKNDDKGRPQLCQFYNKDVSFLFEEAGNARSVVFLGVKKDNQADSKTESEIDLDGQPWFAVDVADIPKEKIDALRPGSEYLSGAGGMRLMQLEEKEAGIAAQARSLLDWHARYKYCPSCGNLTSQGEAGYKRVCESKECTSNKGIRNTSYPRLDPVVIMLVVSPSGDKCLLGRQQSWPPGMYSCLAGFMEPGETMEDAVRREVAEESGIQVGRVVYHSNQPWPRPSTLMLGCIGFAVSEQIKVDKDELEDAQWFTRQRVLEMMDGLKGFIPPQKAIAFQLIKAWLGMSSSL
ncbi:NAD-capped RNA hydrolase NUDT12-like [Glandiceps talaboti]